MQVLGNVAELGAVAVVACRSARVVFEDSSECVVYENNELEADNPVGFSVNGGSGSIAAKFYIHAQKQNLTDDERRVWVAIMRVLRPDLFVTDDKSSDDETD